MKKDRVPGIRLLAKKQTRSHRPMNAQNGVVKYLSEDSNT